MTKIDAADVVLLAGRNWHEGDEFFDEKRDERRVLTPLIHRFAIADPAKVIDQVVAGFEQRARK